MLIPRAEYVEKAAVFAKEVDPIFPENGVASRRREEQRRISCLTSRSAVTCRTHLVDYDRASLLVEGYKTGHREGGLSINTLVLSWQTTLQPRSSFEDGVQKVSDQFGDMDS